MKKSHDTKTSHDLGVEGTLIPKDDGITWTKRAHVLESYVSGKK